MSDYQIDRQNAALMKLVAHEARFGRPLHDRRSVSGATPIRGASPADNALLENARDYAPKPSAEAATVWALIGGLVVVAAVKAMPYVVAAVIGVLWTVGLLGLAS